MEKERPAAADGGSPSYSFLVHAQATMGVAEPGSLREDYTLGQKSKRRRTSPEDHAILEAAYQANSKPGKDERANVVSQVKLGEKEVQIWFQNRRQNDRRRSKPLQPHELIAHIARSTASPPATFTPDPSQGHSTECADDTLVVAVTTQATPSPTPSPGLPASQPEPPIQEYGPSSKDATQDETTPETISRSQPASPTSSGRKRSYHEVMQPTSPVPVQSASALADVIPPKTKEPLKRSSSVRLAVTVDGAVKIRTSDELTPSPEKRRSLPAALKVDEKQRRLSRGISMVDDLKSTIKAPTSSGVFGRSRDHRKWEFYCDKSADKPLFIQAEAERSGSAVGAINLIRSNSLKGRGRAMSPAPSRANVKPNGQAKSGKPKLSRAKSSLARLNSQPNVEMKAGSKTSRRIRSPSDSDKENWAPGTRKSENLLRRTQPSTNRRPILQDNEAVIFPDAATASGKGAVGKLSPRKEKARGEDLDCIQGLLSLSQGAWR